MITVTKDGRTIKTGKDYTKFRLTVWVMQANCIECTRYCQLNLPLEFDDSFHVSHRGSRGMGSAIRDDVIGPKRGQVEGGKCGKCHRIEHNQQSAVQSQPQWSRA